MTISTSVDFSMTRDDIIRAAFRKLGVLSEGQQPSAQMVKDGAQALNLMVKHWQSKGLNLWTLTEAILFQTYGQAAYPLGPGSTTRACRASGLVETTVSVDAVTGDTLIAMTSTTGLTSGMIIGVYCSTTLIHWTTISGAPVAGIVTLADALPADADAGSAVFSYATTSIVGRPMSVPNARRRLLSTGADVPMAENTRDEYFLLPIKSSFGAANQFYYDPQIGQGVLYIWPVADDLRQQIRFTYNRVLTDMDAISDNPDYPQEWYYALVWGLADDLAPEYGVETKTADKIQLKAVQAFNDLSGFDTDIALYIQPAIRIA